jgi:hypothetical protein
MLVGCTEAQADERLAVCLGIGRVGIGLAAVPGERETRHAVHQPEAAASIEYHVALNNTHIATSACITPALRLPTELGMDLEVTIRAVALVVRRLVCVKATIKSKLPNPDDPG